MKKITLIAILFVSLSACKKDCSGDYWANADFIDVKKTSSGVCIKNKYILPIHVTKGFKINGQSQFDIKILSGLSHTIKFSDMDFIKNGGSSEAIKYGFIFYRRGGCDYGNRQTMFINYHQEVYSYQF